MGEMADHDAEMYGLDPFRSTSMGAVIGSLSRPRRRASAPDPVDAAVAYALAQRDEEAEADRIQAAVEAKLAQVDALGANQLPDKAVVAFTKRHEEGGFAYSYVALHIGGYWYLSGDVNGSKRRTNAAFCAWLLSGEGFDEWEVLRGAPEVGDEEASF
jgi:hypothetical protein